MMGAAGAISTLPSQTLFARASKVAHGRALRGLEAMLSSQCCMQTMLQPTSCRLSARDAQAQDLIIRRAQHAQVALLLPGRSSVCGGSCRLFCSK